MIYTQYTLKYLMWVYAGQNFEFFCMHAPVITTKTTRILSHGDMYILSAHFRTNFFFLSLCSFISTRAGIHHSVLTPLRAHQIHQLSATRLNLNTNIVPVVPSRIYTYTQKKSIHPFYSELSRTHFAIFFNNNTSLAFFLSFFA